MEALERDGDRVAILDPEDQVELVAQRELPFLPGHVIVLRAAKVECATCGARGELAGDAGVRWTDLTCSVIAMDEKRAHFAEIRDTAQRHAALRDRIEEGAAPYDEYDPSVRPPQDASA